MTNEEIEHFIRVLNYLRFKCDDHCDDNGDCYDCKLKRVCNMMFQGTLMPMEITPYNVMNIESELKRVNQRELYEWRKYCNEHSKD